MFSKSFDDRFAEASAELVKERENLAALLEAEKAHWALFDQILGGGASPPVGWTIHGPVDLFCGRYKIRITPAGDIEPKVEVEFLG